MMCCERDRDRDGNCDRHPGKLYQELERMGLLNQVQRAYLLSPTRRPERVLLLRGFVFRTARMSDGIGGWTDELYLEERGYSCRPLPGKVSREAGLEWVRL